MDLVPTRREAQLIVLSVQTFWLICGLGLGLLFRWPVLSPLLVVGFAGGFLFYWLVFRVAGRELGRPTSSFLLPTRHRRFQGSVFVRAREDWRVLFKIVDPRWWHRIVAPATGWPPPIVDGVMIVGLLAAVVGQNVIVRSGH